MVYKRYIKINGRLYGPYQYGSKREGNKIVSEYVGKSERKFGEEIGRSVKKFPVEETGIILSSIAVVILLLVFIYNPVLLGNVIINETTQLTESIERGVQDYKIQDLSPGSISSCGNLSSTGTYTLNQSVSTSGETCFIITANNVVLDGNGFTISSTEGSGTYGIYSNSMSEAMIKNITVVDFNSGLKFETAVSNSVINNSNFSSNSQNGIHLSAAGGMTLQNLYIFNNVEMGIKAEGTGQNNNFINIKSNSNTQYGLYLLDDYSGLVISNSQFNNNLEGIYSAGGTSSGLTAKNISANANTNHGFYFNSLSSSTFKDITATNSQNGISIDTTTGTLNFLNLVLYGNSINNINVPSASSFKYNNSDGEINWIDSSFLTSSIAISKAMTFPGNITISPNFVYLNSEVFVTGLNSSADVTLYNVPVFDHPVIKRDGVECNKTTLPICVNSTALTAGTVVFNVTSWSNYSIANLTSGAVADTSPPVITIDYPQNITYNVNVSALNYSVSDASAVDKCWYSLNSGGANTTLTCGTNATGLTSVEGSNTWRVYSNDTGGYENYTDVTFFKDTIIPSIDFGMLTESSGAYLNRNNTVINVTVTDANTVNITIRLFNSTGLFNETNRTASSSFVNITNLRDGIYYFNATTIDWAGNSNSTATRNVTIDTTLPIVNITSPTNTTYTTSSVGVAFSLDESGSCQFSVNNGGTNETMTANSSNTGFSATKSSLSNGNYLLWAYCNDTVGNRNDTQSVNFSVSVAASSAGTTGGGGGGGTAKKIVPVNMTSVNKSNLVSESGAKGAAVALAPVVEAIGEGVKTSGKAFVFTRPMRIAVEAAVAGIGLIAAILAYFKIIVPAEMAFVFGKPRRRFMKLVNDARGALEEKDYRKARAIYEKMRFNYHTLSTKEQADMKDEMDEIYSEINNR